jgi:hypothetical protein
MRIIKKFYRNSDRFFTVGAILATPPEKEVKKKRRTALKNWNYRI